MWKAGIAQLLALMIVPVGFAAGLPSTPTSGFGQTLDEAKKKDFFQFFNLEQTGELASNGGKVITFQPSGPKFHDLVRANMTIDAKGQIVEAQLILQRSFVDSSSDGIFARDIAKSFLLGGVNPQDGSKVEILAKEVGQLKGSDRPVIVAEKSLPPQISGPPSDGYDVYLGKRGAFQLALPHGQSLTLQNSTASTSGQMAGGPTLTISYRPKS